ncbi:MAG: hypothetical protein Q4A21_00900 [bacterium]|nr:hypothetical protein [bacterium]
MNDQVKTNEQLFKELKLKTLVCKEKPPEAKDAPVEAIKTVVENILGAPDTGFSANQITGIGLIGLSLAILLAIFIKK